MSRLLRQFIVIILLSVCALPLTYADSANPHTPKKWTFIIFMNGKNSLDRFARENLKSLEAVGSNENVNIVVQWGSLSSSVKRLYVEKSNDPNNVTSPILQDLGSVDMGDYRELQAFTKWAVENFPAEHYFVDVWNHGNGWSRRRLLTSRDISYDDLTGNSIKTEELGQAMAYTKSIIGHNVDIYGSDACLMAMIEVAGEMADSVDYFVGSQELEPGEGWPYEPFMKAWQARGADVTPSDITKILVDKYVEAYSGGIFGHNNATMSALDLHELPGFYQSYAAFAGAMMQVTPAERSAIVTMLPEVEKFFSIYGTELVDLTDVLQHLEKMNLSTVKPESFQTLYNHMNKLIIANKTTERYTRAFGLSIWFPADNSIYEAKARNLRYEQLKFNQATHWGSTLSALLQGVHDGTH